MKVICIDARDRENGGFKNPTSKWLVEGEIYTVIDYWPISLSQDGNVERIPVYTLQEWGRSWGFEVDRFVPLSSIDEKEFERNYNIEPVKI